jgi:hypothetical protein
MNVITSRSYRLFALVIIMVISAIFATLATIPGLARVQDATFCYSDGCVTLPVGPNGNVLATQATSASGLMSAIDARNVSLYGTSYSQSGSNGNLTSVACNNGVTVSAVYKKPAPAATYPPPPPPPPTCSIKFKNNPITDGSSTVMRWSSTNAELFYINGFGYVGASGKATVAPSQSTDYSGYVSDLENGGDAVNCSATLVVRPSACPPQVRHSSTVSARPHAPLATSAGSTSASSPSAPPQHTAANPASIDKTVTVNLIPNFNEK